MTPTILLVEPENPLNVGFVVRAMKCSGCSDLRIVAPQGIDLDLAYRTGTSATEILDTAQIFDSLAGALADLSYSVGFSRRTFKEAAGFALLKDLPEAVLGIDTVGFVFGRESQGLFREELTFCSLLCTIPMYGSMSYNLGQAVAVALYEMKLRNDLTTDRSDSVMSASFAQKEAFYRQLTKTESFIQKNDRDIQLRTVITKLSLTSDELSLLMGAIKAVSH